MRELHDYLDYSDQPGSYDSDQPDDPELWTIEHFVDEVEDDPHHCFQGLVQFLKDVHGGQFSPSNHQRPANTSVGSIF